jgi:hypothetical protein
MAGRTSAVQFRLAPPLSEQSQDGSVGLGCFANLKRLALGVYHGFRRKHIQAYLDEFVFRWNRRRHFRSAFDTLMGIGLRTGPMDYGQLIGKRTG